MIFTARKNLKLDVSNRQVEILVGCLLGDAYLTKLGKIQIEQSEKQKEYVDWKYQELASISYSSGPKKVIRFEKRDNRVTKSYRFWTRQYFRKWREIFYRDNCKIYPKDLTKWITPLSIAIWHMDDGCYSKGNCIFSTESFDLESRQELAKRLKTFEIETILMSNGKLRVRKNSLPKFFELIRPYIHPSMYYKLP